MLLEGEADLGEHQDADGDDGTDNRVALRLEGGEFAYATGWLDVLDTIKSKPKVTAPRV